MTLNEFLQKYYKKKNPGYQQVFHDLILPGSYHDYGSFRKDLAWNLERPIFYTEVIGYKDEPDLEVKLSTGRITLYCYFKDEDFVKLLEEGLKKNRSYRKEKLGYLDYGYYMYYSRKYE